ncbi:MAG: hypothetical protein NTY50_02525 [Methylobacter sp.]|nr:hypothetical protein [Methylobacter sp.]
MHTLELDDYTYENLMKYAAQAGKTPTQWLQELITQFQNKSRPVGLAKDKGVPLPDAFFEPLPDEFLTEFSEIDFENPRPITELIGKAKGCFKDAAEIDAFIRDGRDAWDEWRHARHGWWNAGNARNAWCRKRQSHGSAAGHGNARRSDIGDARDAGNAKFAERPAEES